MATQDTVRVADLKRLRSDWYRQQMKAEAQQTDKDVAPAMKRILAMQARTLHTCCADLDDLIHGREHPSKRRGERA